MGSYRASRTEEDIKRELSDIIRSLKDPRISGLISIVKLDLSHDMSYCKVYISAMEGMEAAKNAVKGLQSAAGFIKRELNLRMKLRRLPEFKFIADDSIAYSAGIAKMLREKVRCSANCGPPERKRSDLNPLPQKAGWRYPGRRVWLIKGFAGFGKTGTDRMCR